jgi:hypothetical protein
MLGADSGLFCSFAHYRPADTIRSFQSPLIAQRRSGATRPLTLLRCFPSSQVSAKRVRLRLFITSRPYLPPTPMATLSLRKEKPSHASPDEKEFEQGTSTHSEPTNDYGRDQTHRTLKVRNLRLPFRVQALVVLIFAAAAHSVDFCRRYRVVYVAQT